MQCKNVLPQNTNMQVNTTSESESSHFNHMSHVQQQLSNFSVCAVDPRFNTKSSDRINHSGVLSRVKSGEASNPKLPRNQSNRGDASMFLQRPHGDNSQPVMTHVASSEALQYQEYQCWSATASSCSTKALSVKDEDLAFIEEPVSPPIEQITISNFPVNVEVINKENETIGFNQKCKVTKSFKCFNSDREQSNSSLMGFSPKLKGDKTTKVLRNEDQLSSKEPNFFNKKHNKPCNFSLKVTPSEECFPGEGFKGKRTVTKKPFSGIKQKRNKRNTRFSFTSWV